MSISITKFRTGNFKKKRNNRDQHPILLFLMKNKSRAYKVSEIVKAVKVKEDTCRSMLRMLEKDKVIEHKSPYFAIRQKEIKKTSKKKKVRKNAR